MGNISYAVPCEAVRVFCGFPRPEFSQAQFFDQLGRTFMPGTPYMLQPLGLAAYLPGVLAAPAAGLPSEFALICYPSAEIWDKLMHGTLRGRVYNQTHGGVYASTSGAAFPVRLADLPATARDPFYLFDRPIDWQEGVTQVAVAARSASMTATDFHANLRQAFRDMTDALVKEGVDQVIVAARDDFLVAWFHSDARSTLSLDFLSQFASSPSVLLNQRVICRDEPPVLQITESSAFNLIFLREGGFFLR